MRIPDVGLGAFLGAGETHVGDEELASGDFLRFEVEQLGIDVLLQLRNPAGDVVARADSPTGPRGPEELVAVVAEGGTYRLEIASPVDRGIGGHYRVVAVEKRRAKPRDERWVVLTRAYEALRVQRKKGEFAAARIGFEAQVRQWRDLGLRRWMAYSLEELCWARRGLGDTEGALEACEEAVVWYRQLGLRRRLGNVLQMSSSLLLRSGAVKAAKTRLEEAESIFVAEEHWRGLINNLGSLGGVAASLGDSSTAQEYLRRGVDLAEQHGEARLQGILRNDLGAILLGTGRTEQALATFESAVEALQQTGPESELSLALSGLARSALRLERSSAAEEAVSTGLETLGNEGDPRSRAVLLLTKGSLERIDGDFEQALATFQHGLTIAREAGLPLVEADLLLAQGHCLGLTGEPASGLERLQRARSLFEEAGVRAGIASTRARGAETLRALGRLEEAWEWLEPALGIVEELRHAAARRDHRLSFFAFRQDYFVIARDLLLEWARRDGDQSHVWSALEVEERRRARELLTSLEDDQSRPVEEGSEVWQKQERLEAELRTLALADVSAGVEGRVEEIVDELHRLRGRFLAERLATPEESASAPEIDLRAIQNELDETSALLVFSLGKEKSLAWTLDAEGLEVRDLPPQQALEQGARAFGRAIASPDPDDLRLVRPLGRSLAEDLWSGFPRGLPAFRLAIVTEGALQTVPFAALPLPGSEEVLLDRHEIVHLPSVAAWSALRRRSSSRPTGERKVVFADPVFSTDDPRMIAKGGDSSHESRSSHALTDSMASLGLPIFARLRASGWEAEAISSLVRDVEIYRGFGVSRKSFLSLRAHPLALLHVATHALLHPQPELSGLVLSRFDADGRPIDGFLPAIELAHMSLAVDLVVLSACQTSIGKDIPGEGSLTLAWSFLDSGADRVVASLWKVSDVSTAELMLIFYEQLEAGATPSAALRLAQLEMARRTGSTPYDWAGFVFHGDWR